MSDPNYRRTTSASRRAERKLRYAHVSAPIAFVERQHVPLPSGEVITTEAEYRQMGPSKTLRREKAK